MKMYLPLYSFNARSKHEKLYQQVITFEDEETAYEIITKIKMLNHNKEVVFTCAKCEVPHMKNPRYADMLWKFGYKNVEDRNIVSQMIEDTGLFDNHTAPDIKGEAICPFAGEI
jgi:hypothetical protein